ncbi:MAG TPA: CidA/LrgA family protein [Paracoccaceae bacterium]|nr:CidA/LrgA family protein [Paracoccaceae bacterium]
MIGAIATLLAAQLAGETLTRALSLPLPGPVIGMALLLGLLALRPASGAALNPVAQALLGNLTLLFVPAGVGVVGHIGRLGEGALGLALAILVSTAAAIAAGALVFAYAARRLGQGPDA